VGENPMNTMSCKYTTSLKIISHLKPDKRLMQKTNKNELWD